MKKKSNGGFTLVELIATIVLLAIVAGIGVYAITKTIQNSKEGNYNLLIKNIKSAAETYYQECKYDHSNVLDEYCRPAAIEGKSYYRIDLKDMIFLGYLEGNAKTETEKFTIVNPITDENIEDCTILVRYDAADGKTYVKSAENLVKCPTNDKDGYL